MISENASVSQVRHDRPLDEMRGERSDEVHQAHLRDPVDGSAVTIIDDDEEVARLFWEFAARQRFTIKEAYRMLRVALYGPVALDDEFDPFAEIKRLQREAKQDHALLNFPPSVEAEQIWQRARDGLRWVAARHPNASKRAELERFLAEREFAMEKLRDKARALMARRA